jgi:hypothetical protein
MSMNAPFFPKYGSGVVVSAAAGSASASLDPTTRQVVVTNLGTTNVAYVRLGIGAQTATTADFPVPPGAQITLTKGLGADTIAYISASGTSLHLIAGEGW